MLNKSKTLHLVVSLAAIALMATVPFLMAHHYNPIPTFFQEWTAAALSFVALTFLWRGIGTEPLDIPEIALLPVGLMLLAAVQWMFLSDVQTDRLLIFGCYMVWTIVLVILGRRLAQTCGLQAFADILATAILIGALLEALTGGIQLAGLARLPWTFPHVGGGLRGNLAQPNNFADHLWLGVASALYLRTRGRLGVAATAACFLVLLPFAVLSGSRSGWLYAIGLAVFSLAWAWRQPDRATRMLARWSIGALVGSLLCQLAFNASWVPVPANIATSGTRLAQGSYDSVRLALWRIALDAFLENPWLGAGFGQYTRQVHLHVLDLMPWRSPGLPEHAHNIVLNLLAEMGLAAGLLLLILVGRWVAGLLRAPRTPEVWWIIAMALVLGIHSNLEYPLWYGFFLAVAALLAGAGSRTNRVLQPGRSAPYAMAAFLALGGLTLYNLHRDYGLLEDALNGRLAAASAQEGRQLTEDALKRLARESLLRPYVDLAVANLMADDRDNLELKLQNCDRAQRFSASRDIVFKCAHLLALAGRQDEGRLALRRAVAAYPDRAEEVLAQWKKRSAAEPSIARLVAEFPTIVK
ncbi:MAG: lipid core-O-antigen ligase-like enyme [Rhodocyclaceae bacterium]|nr:lipid core-O-antigen ligase-like enyme [Rhodocyclaceae bacterium]